MPMLGIKASRDEVDDLFDAMDQDGSGSIEYLELKDLLESEANSKEFPKSPLLARNEDAEDEPTGCCQRKCGRCLRTAGVFCLHGQTPSPCPCPCPTPITPHSLSLARSPHHSG